MNKKVLIIIIAAVVVIAAVVGVVLVLNTNKEEPCAHENEIILDAVEPTCQQTGLTQGRKCVDCGEILSEQVVVPKVNCEAGTEIVDKQVSHTEDGKVHTECIYCKKIMTEVILEAGNKKMTYTLKDDGTYEVTSLGGCEDKEIVIPSEYNGKPVTSVGYAAFMHTSIKSVTIPDSVKTIADEAFLGCGSLVSVELGNSVESIGRQAFRECRKLESIVLPDSVTTIGENIFLTCELLTDVTLSSSLEKISNSAFENCVSLKNVTIPESVKIICMDAFQNCKDLESIVLPDQITTIEMNAFDGCVSLAEITIPVSLATIDSWAFNGCTSLANIYYGGTKSKWATIGKGPSWDDDVNNCTVHCGDGYFIISQ